MTTLNAMASNAYSALIAETLRDNPGDVWAGFENERDAFEAGYEAAASQAVDREALKELAAKWAGVHTAAGVQLANIPWAEGIDDAYHTAAAELLALFGGDAK